MADGPPPAGARAGRERAQAIGDAELFGIFDVPPERRAACWVLAVSGGSDSTALMYLVYRWRRLASARDMPLPDIAVATVDHGLRPESAAEAQNVGAQARALGFAHETLAWTGAKPALGVQAAARQARYQLLGEFVRRLEHAHGGGRSEVLTAHHLDDQAETFLMRLARGSGLDGLAAMRTHTTLEIDGGQALHLWRPLLWLPKARLIATLEAAGVDWIEDPSNDDAAFERVRLRKLMPALASAGITAAQIGRSVRRLQRAREGQQREAHGAWPSFDGAVDWHRGAYASVDRSRVTGGADAEIRMLAAVLDALGPSAPPVRLSQVEALHGELGSANARTWTLNECIVTVSDGRTEWEIYREPGRAGLPTVQVAPGEETIWDRRFRVRLDRAAPGPLTVKALGPETWAALKRAGHARPVTIPQRAAVTLPSVWRGEDLLAVPHLGWSPPGAAGEVHGFIEVLFAGADVTATLEPSP